MSVPLKNIISLTDFQRNAKEITNKVKETRKPYVVTVNGRAEMVLTDADSYQALLDRVVELEDAENLRLALIAEAEAKFSPWSEAVARLDEKLADL